MFSSGPASLSSAFLITVFTRIKKGRSQRTRHQRSRRVRDTWTTRRWKYSCWPCTDRTIAFVDLLLTSKRWQSPYCNINRGTERGGLVLSYRQSLRKAEEREDFEEGTEWKSVEGWRSGASARLPPMCPGFDSRTQRHMWVEFVVGSLLCSERFFPGYSGFPLSSKPIFPNSNSSLESVPD